MYDNWRRQSHTGELCHSMCGCTNQKTTHGLRTSDGYGAHYVALCVLMLFQCSSSLVSTLRRYLKKMVFLWPLVTICNATCFTSCQHSRPRNKTENRLLINFFSFYFIHTYFSLENTCSALSVWTKKQTWQTTVNEFRPLYSLWLCRWGIHDSADLTDHSKSSQKPTKRTKCVWEGGVELRITLWASRWVPACTRNACMVKWSMVCEKCSFKGGGKGLGLKLILFVSWASANICGGPLGLDINTKHTHFQTLARQDKERQDENTFQGSRTHSAPGRTRTRMHMRTNQSTNHEATARPLLLGKWIRAWACEPIQNSETGETCLKEVSTIQASWERFPIR